VTLTAGCHHRVFGISLGHVFDHMLDMRLLTFQPQVEVVPDQFLDLPSDSCKGSIHLLTGA